MNRNLIQNKYGKIKAWRTILKKIKKKFNKNKAFKESSALILKTHKKNFKAFYCKIKNTIKNKKIKQVLQIKKLGKNTIKIKNLITAFNKPTNILNKLNKNRIHLILIKQKKKSKKKKTYIDFSKPIAEFSNPLIPIYTKKLNFNFNQILTEISNYDKKYINLKNKINNYININEKFLNQKNFSKNKNKFLRLIILYNYFFNLENQLIRNTKLKNNKLKTINIQTKYNRYLNFKNTLPKQKSTKIIRKMLEIPITKKEIEMYQKNKPQLYKTKKYNEILDQLSQTLKIEKEYLENINNIYDKDEYQDLSDYEKLEVERDFNDFKYIKKKRREKDEEALKKLKIEKQIFIQNEEAILENEKPERIFWLKIM